MANGIRFEKAIIRNVDKFQGRVFKIPVLVSVRSRPRETAGRKHYNNKYLRIDKKKKMTYYYIARPLFLFLKKTIYEGVLLLNICILCQEIHNQCAGSLLYSVLYCFLWQCLAGFKCGNAIGHAWQWNFQVVDNFTAMRMPNGQAQLNDGIWDETSVLELKQTTRRKQVIWIAERKSNT